MKREERITRSVSRFCAGLEALLLDLLVPLAEEPASDRSEPCDDPACDAVCVVKADLTTDVAAIRRLLSSYAATLWCSDWTSDLVVNALGWRQFDDRERAELALEALVAEGVISTELQAGVRVYNVSPITNRQVQMSDPVTSSRVSAEIAALKLRVGMTWQEVADNKWTKCDLDGVFDSRCTGEKCSACVFLGGAMCVCGHPFTIHHPAPASFADDCAVCSIDNCVAFSLAAWPGMPAAPPVVEPTADTSDPPVTNEQHARDVAHVVAVVTAPVPSSRRVLTIAGKVPAKPWHESASARVVLCRLRDALAPAERKPPWSKRTIRRLAGLSDNSDTNSAVLFLVSSGELNRRGNAYAPHGFVWPVKEKRLGILEGAQVERAERLDALVDELRDDS